MWMRMSRGDEARDVIKRDVIGKGCDKERHDRRDAIAVGEERHIGQGGPGLRRQQITEM